MRISVRYDMRVPPEFDISVTRAYAAALDQAAWADGHGFDSVVLSEHHGAEDGYLPSPIVLASAMAARTTRVRIRLSVLLLTLCDPVRAAEDLAVLDIVSGGRLEVTLGAGYRPEEFAMFGRQLSQRAQLMERGVQVLKEAWTGEPFEHDGETIRVRPTPAQKPRPLLILGGSTKAAARRAARIADGFAPTEAHLVDAYLEACDDLGNQPGRAERRLGPMFVHVSEDPDREWARIMKNAMHETNSYAQWLCSAGGGVYSPALNAADLRESGAYQVLTPGECIDLLNALRSQGNDVFSLHPLMGGMDPDLGWQSLELFASTVLPRIAEGATVTDG